LVRLVGRLARDREALVPALRHAAGGKAAEQRQDHPGRDHPPPVPRDEVCEASEPPVLVLLVHADFPQFGWLALMRLLDASKFIAGGTSDRALVGIERPGCKGGA